MPRPLELEPSEVLNAIKTYDSRMGPALSTKEVADLFPDYSRETIRRKLKQLVEQGDLRYAQHARVMLWWTPTMFACPHCGGDIERRPDYIYGMACVGCEAKYLEIETPDARTKAGRTWMMGRRMLRWWKSLSSTAKLVIRRLGSDDLKKTQREEEEDGIVVLDDGDYVKVEA